MKFSRVHKRLRTAVHIKVEVSDSTNPGVGATKHYLSFAKTPLTSQKYTQQLQKPITNQPTMDQVHYKEF